MPLKDKFLFQRITEATNNLSLFSRAVYALQLIVALLYGLRLHHEMGTDFGIYYVGANSFNSNYGLYSDFFDHKGPLFYLFLKFIAQFLPFSSWGASVSLFFTACIWFISINLGIRMLKLSPLTQTIGGLCAIASLVSQPSNSSIAIFAGSFAFLTFASAAKYVETNMIRWNMLAQVFAAGYTLVRIDGIVLWGMCLILLFWVSHKQIKAITISLIFSLTLAILPLYIMSKILFFSLDLYYKNAILFNLTTYKDWVNPQGFISIFKLTPGNTAILLSSGILFVFTVRMILSWNKLESHKKYSIIFTILTSIPVYIFMHSDKNYHLFILYPALIFSIILFDNFDRGEILSIFSVLIVPTLLIIYTLSQESKCVFTDSCHTAETIFHESTQQLQSKDIYAYGQGWPFILTKQKPEYSFNPYFPLLFDLGEETKKALEDSKHFENESRILLDLSLPQENPRVISFLNGRKLVATIHLQNSDVGIYAIVK